MSLTLEWTRYKNDPKRVRNRKQHPQEGKSIQLASLMDNSVMQGETHGLQLRQALYTRCQKRTVKDVQLTKLIVVIEHTHTT